MAVLAMEHHSTFEPKYDLWEPPEDLYILLTTLPRTRDRVEAVWAFYARDHHGQGPFASEIARVIGINKRNVERCLPELIAEGRATKIHGRFVLIRGQYTHPVVASLLD